MLKHVLVVNIQLSKNDITLRIFNVEFKYKFKDIYYLLKIKKKKIIEITEYFEINS